MKSGDKLPADPGITEASAHLPSPRATEGFLAVDSLLSLVKDAAKAFGEEEIPFDVAKIDAPLAFSASVQDKISRFDVIIPTKLIKAGKESFDKYSARSKDEDFDSDDEDAPGKKQAKAEGAKKKAKPADMDKEGDDAVEKPKAKEASKEKAKPKKPEKKDEDDGDEK